MLAGTGQSCDMLPWLLSAAVKLTMATRAMLKPVRWATDVTLVQKIIKMRTNLQGMQDAIDVTAKQAIHHQYLNKARLSI